MSYWLATVLTVLGLGLFLYKALTPGLPVLPGEKSDLWAVGARVKFSARGRAVKVILFIPRSTRRLAVVDENFISRGFGHDDRRRQSPGRLGGAPGERTPGPLLPCRGPGARAWRPGVERAASEDRYHPTTSRLAPGRGRVAAERDAKAVGRSRHPGRPVVKRLADPKPDSNVALVLGHHPDPVKVCEAAVRVLALAQTLLPRLRHIERAATKSLGLRSG